jgi:multiple sugar transport system permease protein
MTRPAAGRAAAPDAAQRPRARRPLSRRRHAWVFLAPSAAILAVFVFAPLISSFALSGLSIDIFMSDVGFAGLDNFRRLAADGRVWGATLNTLYFAAMAVPAQVILALALASIVSRDNRWCRLLRSVYYVPFVCSMTAISIVWSILLDPNMGALSYVTRQLGWGTVGFLKDPALAMPTVVAITTWKGFGYLVTLLSAAILNVPASLEEAAQLDGAGPVRRFVKITVPVIWPTVVFCVVTTTIVSLQVFDQVYIMTKGGPHFSTETLVAYIYNRGFQTAPYDLGYASSIAVYLFAIIAIITFVLRRFVLRRGEDEV